MLEGERVKRERTEMVEEIFEFSREGWRLERGGGRS